MPKDERVEREPLQVLLPVDEREWLRRTAFELRCSMTDIVRSGLELFKCEQERYEAGEHPPEAEADEHAPNTGDGGGS